MTKEALTSETVDEGPDPLPPDDDDRCPDCGLWICACFDEECEECGRYNCVCDIDEDDFEGGFLPW